MALRLGGPGRGRGGPGTEGTVRRKRRKVALWLVSALVLVLVPGRCARDNIAEKEREAAVLRRDTAFLETQVQQSMALEVERTGFEQAFDEVRAAMPDQPMLPEAIEQLVALAGRTGVRLWHIGPSQPDSVANPDGDSMPAAVLELALVLQVDGDESEVLDFIDGLRSLTRLVVVDSLSLSWVQDLAGAEAEETLATASRMELSAALNARMFMWVSESIEGGVGP